MKNETIVDRVVERLKAQPLGDLITEEDLHDIVKTAIPKVFFERVTIENRDRFGGREVQSTEPLIVATMRELLKPSAEKYAREWIDSNVDLLAEHWRKVLDQGILTYVQRVQDERATGLVRDALRPLLEQYNQARRNAGLPEIYL